MANYDNTNKGVIFIEENKKGDTHPDFKGTIDVGGREYWISGWKKVSKKGQKMVSLAVNAKDEAARPAPQRAAASGGYNQAPLPNTPPPVQVEDDIAW